jgi:hypothetical protein
MSVIQNQQTGLTHLVSINGNEITEHNRKFTSTVEQSGSDVELSRGKIRRYIRKNKTTFSLSFTYLPTSTDKTVDGRRGRDYLNSISNIRGTVTLSIKMSPDSDFETYTCFVNSYTEKLVRREISSACAYYDVTIELGEQ